MLFSAARWNKAENEKQFCVLTHAAPLTGAHVSLMKRE